MKYKLGVHRLPSLERPGETTPLMRVSTPEVGVLEKWRVPGVKDHGGGIPNLKVVAYNLPTFVRRVLSVPTRSLRPTRVLGFTVVRDPQVVYGRSQSRSSSTGEEIVDGVGPQV